MTTIEQSKVRCIRWCMLLLAAGWTCGRLPLAAFPRKMYMMRHYRGAFRRAPLHTAWFLLFDREVTNFTYNIANTKEIGGFLAEALRVPVALAQGFVDEIEMDHELRRALHVRLRQRRDRNNTARYGRRAGWYALVRLLKPHLIVETGIHDGLGSALLLRALQRNADEGHDGRLMSFDIDPHAGWLVPVSLISRWIPLIEDSKAALDQRLQGQMVDFFIHDSDHAQEHEKFELETVMRHASVDAVLASDNSHVSPVLPALSEQWKRRYFYFQEVPKGHFYPGGGIGLSVAQRNPQVQQLDAPLPPERDA